MEKVQQICREIEDRINKVHVGCFKGRMEPLLLISETYPGIWLEHVYDSVFFAKLDRKNLYLAENTINLFIQYQKENGQLPCYVWDGNRQKDMSSDKLVGYGQIQELDHLCTQFVKGWTECFDYFKMGQELDPITGEPSASSEWYSSCMLMYLYAAKRLGLY